MPLITKQLQSIRWLTAEVLVVVLGILIAFQVEEWRVYRDDREVERESLQAVIRDLDTARVSYEEYGQFLDKQQEQLVDLIDYLQSTEKREVERLTKLADFNSDYIWGPTQSAFISLRETGNLELISDDELLSELIDYFSNYEGYFHKMAQFHSQGRRELMEVLGGDFELVPDADYRETKAYSTFMRIPLEEFPSHPDGLTEIIYTRESAAERRRLVETGLIKVESLRAKILEHLDSI